MRPLLIKEDVALDEILTFVFRRSDMRTVELSEESRQKVRRSHQRLLEILEMNVPLYGVTTGFGDSCHRFVDNQQSETLQVHLVDYLQCGTGRYLSREATRGMCLSRLISLSRGFSGVSEELIDHLTNLLEKDILPAVPSEGSLGASGDLIPLAYLGAVAQGKGHILHMDGSARPASEALAAAKVHPYTLKAKEGLAIVNGTSTMAGLGLENYNDLSFLTDLALLASSWTCMVLGGKSDAFGIRVNQRAKSHPGQSKAAEKILGLLKEENYKPTPGHRVKVQNGVTEGYVQDRYSLRCAPQVLGPVLDTLSLFATWLEAEINSTSDNPIIDPDSPEPAMGGNFYGGYMGHGMDYCKISAASLADLLDRQLMTIIDDKTNRGLPPNLANWPGLPQDQQHLHHGLKALHQCANALTSEIQSMAVSNTVFSRSSESHNQDKVSMGMGSAVSLQNMIDKIYSVTSLHMICLAQAIDIRKIRLQGKQSLRMYQLIRDKVPYITHDQPLGSGVEKVRLELKRTAREEGAFL